jgi:hypothetical protein
VLAREDCNPLWSQGVVGLYGKLTPTCIVIHHTCSRGPPVRRVRLSPALSVGDSGTRKGAWSGDLSWSRGTDPVPDRPLGLGCKSCFGRPTGQSGRCSWAAWTKSRARRIGIHSRRGLGLARVPVGSGPARDLRSLDPSLSTHVASSFVAKCVTFCRRHSLVNVHDWIFPSV